MSTDYFDAKMSSLRVLVVDDEPILRNLVEHALKSMGIKNISLAADGKKALQIYDVSDQTFDLIICDWIMPKMNGLEVLRQIRGRNRGSKFLMLTANATKEAVTEAIAAGTDSYIAKPFTATELHKKLKSVTKDIVD